MRLRGTFGAIAISGRASACAHRADAALAPLIRRQLFEGGA